MDTLISLALVALIVIVVWLFMRRGGAGRPEDHLRRICLGNEGQVERLIDGEMRRSPGISRSEAASRAVFRYRRDNR